jgi:hypothetical protein
MPPTGASRLRSIETGGNSRKVYHNGSNFSSVRNHQFFSYIHISLLIAFLLVPEILEAL